MTHCYYSTVQDQCSFTQANLHILWNFVSTGFLLAFRLFILMFQRFKCYIHVDTFETFIFAFLDHSERKSGDGRSRLVTLMHHKMLSWRGEVFRDVTVLGRSSVDPVSFHLLNILATVDWLQRNLSAICIPEYPSLASTITLSQFYLLMHVRGFISHATWMNALYNTT